MKNGVRLQMITIWAELDYAGGRLKVMGVSADF